MDSQALEAIRKQFLGIDYLQENMSKQVEQLRAELMASQNRFEGLQTGGDSFCYFMLYHFDLARSVAQNIVVIRKEDFPLFDLHIRIMDMDTGRDVFNQAWGELNAPADYLLGRWLLPICAYYRVFFHARNGSWHQDLILNRSDQAGCWLAATRVLARNGRDVIFVHLDGEFEAFFGAPVWRS